MELSREAERTEPGRMNRRAVTVLSLGHFINDAYSSTIYPLLPLLAFQLRLTELQVFFLGPVLSITSAFMQPLYGFVADRHSRRMFAVLGPVVSGCFISLIGVAPTYWVLLIVLFCGGVGTGAFHPQAVSLAAKTSGDRHRLGVSLFSSSGTLGFALGPLIMALIVGPSDLSRTTYMIGFGVIATLLLYVYCPVIKHRTPAAHRSAAGLSLLLRTLRGVRGPLVILFTITLSRAAIYQLMGNYVPFILKEEGFGMKATGAALTAFMLAGAMGSFAGGAVAERVGGRALSVISGVLAAVFLGAGFLVHGAPGIAFMAVGSFALMTIIPVNITQAQELAPTETSTVSALLMGFAWGVGSLAAPSLGPLAATVGFRTVLLIVVGLPLLAGFWALALPEERKTALKSIEEIPLGASTSGD